MYVTGHMQNELIYTCAMLNVGLVGCGAVVELLHLPPIQARKDCCISALVDPNLERLAVLGEKVPAAVRAVSVPEILGKIDAAIVAVPHYLHADIACVLLRAGKHVLVEKPMALTVEECDRMLIAADAGGASITVGHMRRFCPAVAFAQRLLQSNVLGDLKDVDVCEGAVFGWPVESDFQFRKEKAGGGVLVDTGSHTLDMLIGWFGVPMPVSYCDDSAGGVEADALMHFELRDRVPCRVELSRREVLWRFVSMQMR